MVAKSRIVWTEQELLKTPEEDLAIAMSNTASSQEKLDAWNHFNAKKWYERVVLQKIVELDLPQLSPTDCVEVQQLRYLVGTNPPWKEKRETP